MKNLQQNYEFYLAKSKLYFAVITISISFYGVVLTNEVLQNLFLEHQNLFISSSIVFICILLGGLFLLSNLIKVAVIPYEEDFQETFFGRILEINNWVLKYEWFILFIVSLSQFFMILDIFIFVFTP